METEYFDCKCMSSEHTLRFVYDPDDNELYTEVHLSQYRNVFVRVWVAIKYIFGFKSKYGHWDCWLLKEKDCERLINLTQKVVNGKMIEDFENKT
jgi:hypothetical protein